MKTVKMLEIGHGVYVPEECCSFARSFETGFLEMDDIDLPCGADCRRDCSDCVIQKIMNEYAELKEDKWILCNKKMPEEHDSIFAKLKGTDKWKPTMFEKTSKNVLATVKYDDGTLLAKQAHTVDGKWKTELSCLGGTVIAWKPFPDPYKEDREC